MDPARTSHVADAGGFVYDVAWAPYTPDTGPAYLAVACARQRMPHTRLEDPGDTGDIQIWALEHGAGLRLVTTLVCPGARALRVAWRPAPSRTLGVLAAVLSDGGVVLMDVPREPPGTTLLVTPRVVLRASGAATCVAWASSTRVAIGTSRGHVAVWDLDRSTDALFSVQVHDTTVAALSWHMLPPLDVHGTPDLAARPEVLLSVGWDGCEYLVDVHEPLAPLRLAHSREPRYAAAWMPWAGAWAVDLGDQQAGTVSLHVHDAAKHHALAFHHGRIRVRPPPSPQCLAASATHPYLASGGADGVVKISHVLSLARRKGVDEGSRVRMRALTPVHVAALPPPARHPARPPPRAVSRGRPPGVQRQRRRSQSRAVQHRPLGAVRRGHQCRVAPGAIARPAPRERHGTRSRARRVGRGLVVY